MIKFKNRREKMCFWILLLLGSEGLFVLLIFGLVLAYEMGTILKILLMLTLVAIAPFVILGILATIYTKSVEAIRDKFHIEGKRFAHICIVTQIISLIPLIVTCRMDIFMIVLAFIPCVVYLILTIVFWVREFYKGIMYSALGFMAIIIGLEFLSRALFSGRAF